MGDTGLLHAAWDLLSGVDTLFKRSKLPTTHAANRGEYGKLDGHELQSLTNDITTLRSDMILNPIKRNRVQSLDQLTSQSAVDDLAKATESLLDMFESLVADEALLEGGARLRGKEVFNLERSGCGFFLLKPEVLTNEEASKRLSERFPKLCSLQAELQECSRDSTAEDGGDPPILEVDFELESSVRLSKSQLARTLDRIQFPTDPKSIRSCRRTAEEFGQVFDKVFSKSNGKWKSQNQAREFSDTDIAIIKSARGFSASCSSLFTHITKDTACGKTHEAMVHLSGFERQQLSIMLETCHGTQWVPACFTKFVFPLLGRLASLANQRFAHRSLDGTGSPQFVPGQICTLSPAPIPQSQMMDIGFNDSTMWEMLRTDEHRVAHELRNMKVLGWQRLKSQSRKLLEVLLACSLFQLYGSPWIQAQRWRWETIHLHQYPNNRNQLHQIQPHMLCMLSKEHQVANEIDSEAVAALGVLLMELESNEEANWEDVEDDLEFGAPSHQLRLGIALEKWVDDVRDGYRAIAQACHDFPSLVNMIESDELGLQSKCMAVIYKCILRPLFNLLVTDHSATTALFKGIPGPWASLSTAISITPSKVAKQALFDDVEVERSAIEVDYAKQFHTQMDSFKESMMEYLTYSDHAKIRIAVLDSGVDKSDPMIGPAIRSGKIAKLTGWVGKSSQDTPDQQDQAEWHDTYGHGTHVTKLLLNAAPAAEVYVAKICHKKTINDQFMPGIAKAINWAVEQDVHIISMSFGFKEHHDEIDEAIDNAVRKNKLLFAAASNGGGLSDRPSRPALRSDVMCIYASDGLGNRGLMNPPVDKNKAPYHFSTLGVAVPCRWQRKQVWKSGTSFATPIAAGFAASVLEFVESVKYNWTVSEKRRKVLYQKRGMEAVFKAMSVPVAGDLRFVHPVHLWKDEWSDEEVAGRIETVIKDL